MIVCPNCSHQNPDVAVQCEACYTPLPVMATCPSCGASVQADASFCGQCGFDLRTTPQTSPSLVVPDPSNADENSSIDIPELSPPEPLVTPDPIESSAPFETSSVVEQEPTTGEQSPEAPESAGSPVNADASAPEATPASASPPPVLEATPNFGATQLQVTQAQLLHVQTNAIVDLPQHLSVVRIGKPNDRVPPDIDVSGFPDSEIVSRVHANIRIEGDIYYIEDVGSSNGTYINNMPLPYGNRHRLRSGDRIALGKGDKMTFIFQTA